MCNTFWEILMVFSPEFFQNYESVNTFNLVDWSIYEWKEFFFLFKSLIWWVARWRGVMGGVSERARKRERREGGSAEERPGVSAASGSNTPPVPKKFGVFTPRTWGWLKTSRIRRKCSKMRRKPKKWTFSLLLLLFFKSDLVAHQCCELIWRSAFLLSAQNQATDFCSCRDFMCLQLSCSWATERESLTWSKAGEKEKEKRQLGWVRAMCSWNIQKWCIWNESQRSRIRLFLLNSLHVCLHHFMDNVHQWLLFFFVVRRKTEFLNVSRATRSQQGCVKNTAEGHTEQLFQVIPGLHSARNPRNLQPDI